MNSAPAPKPLIMVEPIRPAPAAEPGRCVGCPAPRHPGHIHCLACALKDVRLSLERDDVQTAYGDLDALIRSLEAAR